ncbi:Protein of unknown function DUF937 [Comamonadaceae bacterium]|jgi:uncharacterized protein YidB (DUF937 family)
MGLFDSVLSAVAQNGGSGGLQDIMGMVQGNPQLMQLASQLLANDGSLGGLQGLVSKFQEAGLGDVVASWIGSGANQPVSADQLTQVLGGDALSGFAQQLGLNSGDVAGQLSTMLPGLVDKLTPGGTLPTEGLGNAGDLLGSLGALLKG